MIYNDIRKNKNKGFSLIELIVVIAIMAVMTAVLAPSLLQYVERSRAQKDDSAMSEVTNAIRLALVDQDVYDECLPYVVHQNHSCYTQDHFDKDGADIHLSIETKDLKGTPGVYESGDYYIFSDATRVLDEVEYGFDGHMRGLTITFTPDSDATTKNTVTISKAIINAGLHKTRMRNGWSNYTSDDNNGYYGPVPTELTLGEINGGNGALYNAVRSAVGETIKLTSQTYRNSDYTVFISMGDINDAIRVYGQWNGTNLSKPACKCEKTVHESDCDRFVVTP